MRVGNFHFSSILLNWGDRLIIGSSKKGLTPQTSSSPLLLPLKIVKEVNREMCLNCILAPRLAWHDIATNYLRSLDTSSTVTTILNYWLSPTELCEG